MPKDRPTRSRWRWVLRAFVLLVALAKTRNELRRPPPPTGEYDPRGFDVIVE